jgi:hypothetical protein
LEIRLALEFILNQLEDSQSNVLNSLRFFEQRQGQGVGHALFELDTKIFAPTFQIFQIYSHHLRVLNHLHIIRQEQTMLLQSLLGELNLLLIEQVLLLSLLILVLSCMKWGGRRLLGDV